MSKKNDSMFKYKWMSSKEIITSFEVENGAIWIPISMTLIGLKDFKDRNCKITKFDRKTFMIEFDSRIG